MSNQIALQAKQPLLRSIHRQVGIVSDLLSHKIEAYRAQHGAPRPGMDSKALVPGAARYTNLTIKLSLGEHDRGGRSPASLGLVVEYTLSLVVHAYGPIWIKLSRKVEGISDAQINRAPKVGAWALLSADGDLSDWKGDLWPAFWPMLMQDMERIVPDNLATSIEDNDVCASVRPGKDFWVDGKCSFNHALELSLWSFKKTPVEAPVMPSAVIVESVAA